MYLQYAFNEGTFFLQSGYRINIGLIECSSISNRIEVNDVLNLPILDGSQVYWRQLKKFHVAKKNKNKSEIIINAQIVGLKYCKYIMGGVNIIVTLHLQQINNQLVLIAKPINKKLPNLQLVFFMGSPISYEHFILQYAKIKEFYYWAQILIWNYGEQYPKAFVTGIFNRSKSAQSQTEAILYALQIDQRQSTLNIQNNCLHSQYLPVTTHKRYNEIVFTIDPPGSIDMDDALSITQLKSNIYQVGIHISDVSSFMNLVERKQLQQKGISFYLPYKTVHLFPKTVIDLCSFHPKKQRLAFTVFFIINQNGDILDTSFQKTIIESRAKLNYEEAQQIIEGIQFNINEFSTKHCLQLDESELLVQKLRILKKIAFNIRKIRKRQDILDRNQITFDLDKKNIPIRVGIKKRFDSERLIEEFMIAANGSVAKKLVQDYGPNALVIHHAKPSQYNINNLNTLFSDFGVRFKNDSIISLENQVKKLFEKEGVKDQFKQALMMRAIQIQELAIYSRHKNSQKGHYGLNLQYYTHFTSPLRRFADVITHQQLTECLTNGGNKQKLNPVLDEQIECANKARLKNKKLRQCVVEGFLNLYLYQNKQKILAKAMVMCLGSKSITLYLPFYNLIKEVCWQIPIVTTNKNNNSVTIQYTNNNKIEEKQICKNDSIDIQIQFDVHQEVKITILIKNYDGELMKI